jgi:lactate dehydrogenase-like 2-hydroxyacid dehydrogenase
VTYQILYYGSVPEAVREELIRRLPEGFKLEFYSEIKTEEKRRAYLRKVDFIMGFPRDFTDEDMDTAENLKMVQLLSAGYDYFDVDLAGKRGILVANNGGANSIAVAEHTILLILSLYKKLWKHQTGLKDGVWVRERNHAQEMYELCGKKIGIIGFGNIGKSLARCLQGFQVKICYYDVVRNEGAERELGARFTGFDELLRASDIVSIHVPLLASTRHMIGERELTLMKRNAILINTARGGIIDDEALYTALRSGVIAGAGLDVLEREEEIEKGHYKSPLMELENVVATPHYAGHTMDTWHRRIVNGYSNLTGLLEGRPQFLVNA